MANPWFRLYNEIATDTKLLLLDHHIRWRYVALLCMKNSGDLDKVRSVTLNDRYMARYMDVTPTELEDTKQALLEVGLISDDWQPTGWNYRQRRDDSKERVRKFRENKRMKGGNDDVTKCNGAVTGGNAVDTDTDTDTELKDIGAKTPPTKKNPKSKRLRFVPDEWVPDDKLIAEMIKELPHIDQAAELKNMRNHEYATPKSDWSRCYRTWMRNADKFGNAKKVSGKPRPGDGKDRDYPTGRMT